MDKVVRIRSSRISVVGFLLKGEMCGCRNLENSILKKTLGFENCEKEFVTRKENRKKRK